MLHMGSLITWIAGAVEAKSTKSFIEYNDFSLTRLNSYLVQCNALSKVDRPFGIGDKAHCVEPCPIGKLIPGDFIFSLLGLPLDDIVNLSVRLLWIPEFPNYENESKSSQKQVKSDVTLTFPEVSILLEDIA